MAYAYSGETMSFIELTDNGKKFYIRSENIHCIYPMPEPPLRIDRKTKEPVPQNPNKTYVYTTEKTYACEVEESVEEVIELIRGHGTFKDRIKVYCVFQNMSDVKILKSLHATKQNANIILSEDDTIEEWMLNGATT